MSDILKLIMERQSARSDFDSMRRIPESDMKQILEAARWAPTAHNMQNFQIIVLDDRQLLDAISEIRRDSDEDFIRENYQQLSFSEEELKKKKVGVLATMFPPSWRVPGIQPELHDEITHSFLGSPVQKCSALLVVIYDPEKRAPASEGDFLGIISLGCLMENMWIMAQALGIGFHVLSALGNGSVEVEAKKLLGVPNNFRIAFAARLGYPLTTMGYLRVRREMDDFTHHNHYGNKGFSVT